MGFGLTLLIGLPLAIFVLQNQTQPSSQAAAVTKFSFNAPPNVSVGQPFDVPITVDPGGQNQVSFVKFTFTYDPTKLSTATVPITYDTTVYTQLDGPNPTCTSTLCTITRTYSVGSNQSAIIKSLTTIATAHFIANANTDPSTPTQLAFVDGQNQALSVATTDQAAENVFQSGLSASITIGNTGTGGSPTPTDSTTPTPTDSTTPTPTGGSGGGSGGSGTSNLSVSCDSFTADNTSGNPPLTVTFTTVGSSSTDSIANIAINYGDGNVDQVATGSGIGTGNINNQISHTYSTNGVYTATATLTTAGGATSNPSSCTQTITIGATASSSQSGGLVQNNKLPATGPGQTILLIGAAGAVLSVVGMLLIGGL